MTPLPTTPPTRTLPQCIEEFIRSKRQTGAANSTVANYEQQLATFKYRTLSYQSVDAYIAQLLAAPTSNATKLLYLRALSAFANWCVQRGYLPSNPVRKVSWRAAPPKRIPITPEDYEKIKAEVHRHHHPDSWLYAVTMGWHTGMRIGDVCRLPWSAVDMTRRVLAVTPNKTKRLGKNLEIPFGGELATALEAMVGKDPEMVSPYLAHAYSKSIQTPSQQFSEMVRQAGIVPHKTFHCFRHAFVTRLLGKNYSAELIGTLTGQSIQQILAYRHTTIETKREMLGIT